MKKLINTHGLDFDHRRCFYSYKTHAEIENDLDNAVEYINNFFGKNFLSTDKTSPNYFNDLHQGFEMLNKDYDEPTVLKILTTPRLKESIRDVNYCVHQLEHGNKGKNIIIEWNKQTSDRIPIDSSDYSQSSCEFKSNHVYLSYNEVGKNTKDLYYDNLPIDYPGLKNNHFIGPDIVFCTEDKPLFEPDFLEWCTQNKIDPFDAEQGLLNYPIGTFETFCGVQKFSAQSKITTFDIVDKL